MKNSSDHRIISDILGSGREITVSDFSAVYPDVPMPTVYSKIRSLVRKGTLTRTGKGKYVAMRKLHYRLPVTSWMSEVNDFLISHCEGIHCCISQRGNNLFVEVGREDIPSVKDTLKNRYGKAVGREEYDRFPAPLDGYIVVGRLISEAPLLEESGFYTPSLEKLLVDSLCVRRKDCSPCLPDFQQSLEVYSINLDRMRRYAARKGLSSELEMRIAALDTRRIELFSRVQGYFSQSESVSRVWLFGSFARREETADSDLDLLVDYIPGVKVSLLEIIRQKIDLEKITGRQVDLVENGYLKPFASSSAERDKYLIYER